MLHYASNMCDPGAEAKASRVLLQGEGKKDYLAHMLVRLAHQAMLNFPYSSSGLLDDFEELDEERQLSDSFAGADFPIDITHSGLSTVRPYTPACQQLRGTWKSTLDICV